MHSQEEKENPVNNSGGMPGGRGVPSPEEQSSFLVCADLGMEEFQESDIAPVLRNVLRSMC